MSSNLLLEIKGLSHGYQAQPLLFNELHFSLEAGHQIALTGESGTGKSTLLNLMAGLDSPQRGEVVLMNRSWSSMQTNERLACRRKTLGFIFQAFHLVGHLTALQNVMVPLLLAGQSFKAAQLTAQDWLSRLGLEERINGRPDELSGGQQQRVCIARALAHSPKLVLADEPTGNLDPTTAQSSLNLLCQQCRQTGAALVMVTHSHQAAQQLDAHYELAQGRLHPMPKPGLPAGSL
ncbi:MAG: ABC transporter ATP-binding protein [Burkholderiaceae bacterium]